jgi:biotin synthase-like enzyme
MKVETIKYEQGPIRPPSEAASLLIRLTRNCPWNRCLFCPVYKGEQFSRRSMGEVLGDLEEIFKAADQVKAISLANGWHGEVNLQTATFIQSEYPQLFQIAYWLYLGGKTVFLQDGDSLLLPVSHLVQILNLVKEKFPTVNRVTSYARSRTILRRSVEDLKQLKKAGLNRIHIGLESGNDEVLTFMQKGVTAAQQIDAGKRVKEAGISLSEYVILGLGGADLWREHAVDTAKALNAIDPDYIRLRTLAVPLTTPLYRKIEQGEFKPLGDDQIVNEEALFIENLEGINSELHSDHVLNLLEEINGKLPADKMQMLGLINTYLSLPEEERARFRLGRRSGYYRTLKDRQNPSLSASVENIYHQLREAGTEIDSYINQLMRMYI